MADRARTVAQVIAGEAVSGTPAQRYADMVAIASVVANRAKALNTTPEDVVSVRKQFNAYGQPLDKGRAAYVGMAQKAIDQVAVTGPVHRGQFYATPAAFNKIGVTGLSKVAQTKGHVYAEDPKGRAIQTASGFKAPQSVRAAANVPTPTARPATRSIGGLAPSMASFAPAAPAPRTAAAALAGLARNAPGMSLASLATQGPMAARTRAAPSVNPLGFRSAPIAAETRITSGVSAARKSPADGMMRRHNGVDMVGTTPGAINGKTAVAVKDGTVVSAGKRGTFGNQVVVDHGMGLTTSYNHMGSISVKVGDKVTAANPLGTVGSTGRSTGPHMHFEARVNGKVVDPAAALAGVGRIENAAVPASTPRAIGVAPATVAQRAPNPVASVAPRAGLPTAVAAQRASPRAASIGGLLSIASPAPQALARPAVASPPRTASVSAPASVSRLAAVSPALTGFASTARPSAPVKVGQALSPLRAAAAPISARPAPAVASQAKAVASRDITPAALDKSPRLSAPVRTKSTLSPAGEANLAGRLGDVAPARVSAAPSVSPRTSLTAAAPATGAARAIGGLLSPAAAAAPARQVTPTAPVRTTATVAPQVNTARALSPVSTTRAVAPVSTARVAPAVSAPKTLGPVASTARAVSPVDRQAQSLSPVPSTAVAASVRTKAPMAMGPMMSPERALAMDVADLDKQRNIAARPAAALPALAAPVNVPARRVAAVAPVKVAAVAQPKPVAAAPPRQVAARPSMGIGMAAPRGTGLGLPGVPSAPRQPSALGRLGSVIGSNKAAIGGGLIGAAALGPIGGLIGGLIGSAVGRGPAPSQAAKAAMASGSFDGFSHSGSGGSRAGASIGTGGAASGASRGNGIGPGGSGPRDPSGPGTGRNATGSNNNTSKSSSKKR